MSAEVFNQGYVPWHDSGYFFIRRYKLNLLKYSRIDNNSAIMNKCIT